MTFLFGSKHERDVKNLLPIVQKVNEKENWAAALDADGFLKQTAAFKERLANGETLDDILPEAFALAREAGEATVTVTVPTTAREALPVASRAS